MAQRIVGGVLAGTVQHHRGQVDTEGEPEARPPGGLPLPQPMSSTRSAASIEAAGRSGSANAPIIAS
jgi:hypothetical protein